LLTLGSENLSGKQNYKKKFCAHSAYTVVVNDDNELTHVTTTTHTYYTYILLYLSQLEHFGRIVMQKRNKTKQDGIKVKENCLGYRNDLLTILVFL